MPRGPLPNSKARRRNAPTIPTTTLPAAGRKGRIPRPPHGYEFRPAGAAWWRWAWRTPQAAAWDAGSLYGAARRAQLEDDLAALELADEFDLEQLLSIGSEAELARRLEWMISCLKRLAGSSVAVMREARELDKRLGLDPKALAELRWTIVDEDSGTEPAATPAPATRQLRAV